MLELTLDSEQQLPAAEAIIAALHHNSDALQQLDPNQLLDAGLLSDMMQATKIFQQGMELLQKAATAQHSAVVAALAARGVWHSSWDAVLLTAIQSWQACPASDRDGLLSECSKLLHLAAMQSSDTHKQLQSVVVGALCLDNFYKVWRDQNLQDVLLRMPLAGMKLLLESNQLTVDSEDTVYYTAAQYVSKQPMVARPEAIAVLAPLVRCSQLSLVCLSNVATTTDDSLLLSRYRPQLLRLLNLGLPVLNAPSNKRIKLLTAVKHVLADAPGSWRSRPRVGQQQSQQRVSVVWQLPMEQLKQACRASAAEQNRIVLFSPRSPPMGGLAWQVKLHFRWKEGTKVGVYVHPVDTPAGTYSTYSFVVAVPGSAMHYKAYAID